MTFVFIREQCDFQTRLEFVGIAILHKYFNGPSCTTGMVSPAGEACEAENKQGGFARGTGEGIRRMARASIHR